MRSYCLANHGHNFWQEEASVASHGTGQGCTGERRNAAAQRLCSLLSFLKQLKQQRDKLKQYQKRISAALESDRELAKRLLKDGKKELVFF